MSNAVGVIKVTAATIWLIMWKPSMTRPRACATSVTNPKLNHILYRVTCGPRMKLIDIKIYKIQNTHEPQTASSPKRHEANPAQWQNRQLKLTTNCENCELPTIYRPNFSKHIAYAHLHIVYNLISE